MSKLPAKSGFDWITFSLYLSLVVIGWLMLYATSQNEFDDGSYFSFQSTVGKQTIWIGLSLFLFLCTLAIDWKFWNTVSYPVYILSVLLLIAVLFVGMEIKGARAWFSIGGFSFQPSEFAKFGTALALANYLGFFKTNLSQIKYIVIAFFIFLVPAGLVILQPDAGSALIFISFTILLYRKGLSPAFYIVGIAFMLCFLFSLMYNPGLVYKVILLIILLIFLLQNKKKFVWFLVFLSICTVFYLLVSQGYPAEAIGFLISMIALFGAILIQQKKHKLVFVLIPSFAILIGFSFATRYAFDNFLQPHQQDRINVWLKPSKSDPQGSLYNIMQSQLAIGSGGIKGKGFLQGNMTKLNYVPEQSTDFIFSTIGEEQGFVGVVGIVVLFTLLFFRISMIGERTKHKFIQYFAYGFAGILFIHFFINIGMTMGIMPVIGIPLPFISKGGSSLLIFSIMMGILLRMDMTRNS